MALLLPRLSKSSGSSVRINVWRQRRASVAPIGRAFPKSPDLTKKPDETLDLTTIGLSNKYNLLFPVVGNDRIPSRPMDYKEMTDDDDKNSTEVYCTAPNLPELPGLPGERRGLKTPTEPPDFCLKGEGQRLPSYVIGTSKIENSPGGMVLKSICTQLHSWFETLSRQNVDETSIQEELKRLLYIKKMRIYLEVRKKIYSPEVHCVPIFHCPCCLERWTITGWAPENCPNSIQPIRGPEVVMYGTKMRFISMHPKGKTNVPNRKQEFPKRKIGIPVGMSRLPYASMRAKERQDSPSEPHLSSTNPSRASNHLSRDKNEKGETRGPASDLITFRTPPAGEMHVEDTLPELGPKDNGKEEEDGTVCSSADEPEGIPQSRASMSLILSISQNDNHYNEYARSSSRNGRTNEWKKRTTYGSHLYSDNAKSLWKTQKLTSPVPQTFVGEEDKSKMHHQRVALTPVSSNDFIIGTRGKCFDLVENIEATAQNRSYTSQSEDYTSASQEDITGNLQPTFEDPQHLSADLVHKQSDQEQQRERNQTENTLKEREGFGEKQEGGLSSLDKKKRPSTGEEKDRGMVPVTRHSALKKIDQVSTTKHAKRDKNTVTWSDKKVLPKLSEDSRKRFENQDRRNTTSMEVSSPLAANTVSDVEANDEGNAKQSLPSATDHFEEASKALRHIEEQIVKPENQVIKRYVEKSKAQELQLADVHSQRKVESSSAKPLGSRTDKDSVRLSRGISASAGLSDNKKTHHSMLTSEKESLTVEGAQGGFALPHRRRTEILHKKERKTIVKRPKHAFHSKEIENAKIESLPIKPQAFTTPHVPEATALYAKGCLTDTHRSTINIKDASDDNYIYSTAILPSEHAQGWVKQEINDEFRTAVADIRNDIKVVKLELSSSLTPTVKKGNKMDTSLDDEDDDDDDFFEEVDSKTALFSERISSAIHRLPLSNAFTFSFYELPSQYEKRNKKLQMASFKIGHGGRKRTI